MDGSTTTPARLADFGRPGMTAPTSSRIRAVKRTSTTSTTKSGQTSSSSSRNAGPHGNDRGYSVPVDLTSDLMEDQDGQDVNMLHSQQGFKPTTSSMGYSELHLGPATTTSVVTTTTTTTVHFAPILVPRSKPIRPAQSSFSRPDQLPTGPAAVAALLRQDHDDALKLDSKLYPLSQAPFPGGLKRFRLELGDLDATFFEDGRQAAMEAAEASNGQGIESGHEDDGEEYDEESSYKFVGQKQVDKGKGRAVGADADLAFARGPLQQRRLSRRSVRTVQQQHTRPHQQTPQQPRRSSSSEEEEQMSADDGPGQQDTPGGSPGPPRKRPRSGSAQRRASNASDVTHAAALTTGATLFSAGNLGLTSNVTAAALPSPTNSPPSPVPTFAGDDEKQDSDQSVLSPDQHQFDLGSGTALSGLLSLPDFVNTFDQLSPALQSYFIYTFLKRSPIPVLQTINSIVTPALRRDFLTDLPPELGLHIFSFLDAQTLCCASQVSRSWRRLADGEWRVWEQRLIEDGLWIGDGSEEQEAREIMTGSKENLFLKRWRAGVWDQPVSHPLSNHLPKPHPDNGGHACSPVRAGRDELKMTWSCSMHTRRQLLLRHGALHSPSSSPPLRPLEKHRLRCLCHIRLTRTRRCIEDVTRLDEIGEKSSRSAQRSRAMPTTSSRVCSSTKTRSCLLRTTTLSTSLTHRRARPKQGCKAMMEACGLCSTLATCSCRGRRIGLCACGILIEHDVPIHLSATRRRSDAFKSSNPKTSTQTRMVIQFGNHLIRSS